MATRPADAAQNKSGVAPNVISLPSGPGSIEGLGDSFQPDLNSGSARFEFTLKVPPGRGGFAPVLSFLYDSSGSNGIFGLGWRINIPFIQRQTEKGLPHYTLWPDGDGVDNDNDGKTDEYDEFDTLVYSNKEELVPVTEIYWRLENESEFIRFRKINIGWLATRRDGVVLKFGRHENSRVVKEKRVFRWLLDNMVDPNGNVITFEYEKFDDSTQSYISRIIYNKTNKASMELTFKYELRPDIITDFRPGFELKTAYRCTEISVQVGGKRVRRYRLNYSNPSKWRPLSLLASIVETGRDGISFLPPTQFGYTGVNRSGPVVQLLDRAPAIDLNDANVDLLDINSDGLPDIIDTNSQPHIYYINEGVNHTSQVRWANAALMDNSVGLFLGGDDVRFADMNGDGRTDLVNLFARLVLYYSSTAASTWKRETLIRGAEFRFDDPSVKLMDVDHDKRIDVVQSAGGRYLFAWINQGGGAWSGRYTWPLSNANLRFELPTTVLADMNGDRLLDLVYAETGVFHYYPAKGYGEFGEKVVFSSAPIRISDPDRLLIIDVNRDGRGDVVYFGNPVIVWFNLGIDTEDHTQGVLSPPFSLQSPLMNAYTAYRQADVNGNGSTDILWNTRPGQLGFVDFSPDVQPNLLNSVDNGIGGRIRIHYSSSISEMVKDEAAGRPWRLTIPFSVSVVTQKEVEDGRRTYLSKLSYRDGYYDSVEKEFRGFAEVVVTEVGDATAPSLITVHSFDTGQVKEALKGKLLGLETRSSDNRLFFREQYVWNTKVLAQGVMADSRRVTYAFRSTKRLDVFEGKLEPVSVQWDYKHDNFGNVTRVVEHGRLDAGWADERITETTYTSSFPEGRDSWILNRVVEQATQDRNGNRIAGQRHYYDGNATLGTIRAGNPTRVERWVSGTYWIDWERKDYDSFGNVTSIYDGEYREPSAGHFRKLYYDPEFATYPVREVVYTGNLSVPKLEVRATYDPGFGTVTSYRDANGHQTAFAYDNLGRLTAVVRPGDSIDAPTEAYEYVLGFDVGDSIRINWVEMRQREEAGRGSVDSRRFYDGLGRAIMTREESETTDQVVVSGIVQFNERQLPLRKILPFIEKGTLDFSKPPDTAVAIEHQYDALGRLIRLIQPDGSFSTTEYEPFARIVRDEEQTRVDSKHMGAARRFVHDGLANAEGTGRLREVHEIVKITADGLISDNPTEWITRYDYDLLDNVVQIIDSQGNRKRAAFDGLGRKILDDDPNRGVKSYEYDAVSNLRATVDAKGQRITYEYDGANRLVAEDYHDIGKPFSAGLNPDVRYVYDYSAVKVELLDGHRATPRNTLGRLVSVFDISGESHKSYDARGRIEWLLKRIKNPQTDDLVPYVSEMNHDSMGRLTSLVNPDNHRITYSYNLRGFLESIGSHNVIVLTNLDYTPSGQLSHIHYGNGVSTSYEYDKRQRLKRLTTINSEQSPLISYSYQLDSVSNITKINDLRPRISALANIPERVNDQSFVYDDFYRLLQVRYGFKIGDDPAIVSYRYDTIGNLLEQSSNIAQYEHNDVVVDLGKFEYLGGHRGRAGRVPGDMPGPHALTRTSNYELDYDNNGNIVRINDMELTWDFKDRLVTVKSGLVTTDYTYDHKNRRVIKHVKSSNNGTLTESVVQYVDQRYEVRDKIPVKYVFAGQNRVARVIDSNSQTAGSDSFPSDSMVSTSFYHQDHLGSTNVLTDEDGNLVEEVLYFPFGQPRISHRRTSSKTEPYKFTQKELDDETGLQYFEARYYHGQLARFLSVDPVLTSLTPLSLEEPQRLNAYNYSLNRPLIYGDPSGEFAFLIGAVSGVATGYLLAKAMGSPYGWTDMTTDFALGAVGIGVLSKLRHIHKLRQLKTHHFVQRAKKYMVSEKDIGKVINAKGMKKYGVDAYYDLRNNSIVYMKFFSSKKLLSKSSKFVNQYKNKIDPKIKGAWLEIVKDPSSGKLKTLMWQGLKKEAGKRAGKIPQMKPERYVPLP